MYAAKLLLALAITAVAHAVLLLLAMAVAALPLGGSAPGAPAWSMAGALLAALAARLPMLVLQHALSWASQNIILPLAVGVCATMGIIQLGSAEYWRFFPWSYPLMAASGSDHAMRLTALALGLTGGVGLFVLGCWFAGRRRQPA